MILCVTPNPAIDRNLIVRDHGGGGTLRPQETLVLAGGKGVNVARAMRQLNAEPLCAGFLCGHSGRFIEEQLEKEGFKSAWTWLNHGESRSCIILIDPKTSLTTVINENGPILNANDWQIFQRDVLKAATQVDSVCFCGSVPPTSDLAHYARCLQQLLAAGKAVWVDTSGAALQQAATVKGVRLKVNHEEASALLDNMPIQTVTEAHQAAQKLHTQTDATVIITMGGEGAIYFDGQQTWHAIPPQIEVQSAVGSGDSFLAGLLVALEKGESAQDALKHGVATGAANALSVGSAVFRAEDVQTLLAETTLEEVPSAEV